MKFLQTQKGRNIFWRRMALFCLSVVVFSSSRPIFAAEVMDQGHEEMANQYQELSLGHAHSLPHFGSTVSSHDDRSADTHGMVCCLDREGEALLPVSVTLQSPQAIGFLSSATTDPSWISAWRTDGESFSIGDECTLLLNCQRE